MRNKRLHRLNSVLLSTISFKLSLVKFSRREKYLGGEQVTIMFKKKSKSRLQ